MIRSTSALIWSTERNSLINYVDANLLPWVQRKFKPGSSSLKSLRPTTKEVAQRREPATGNSTRGKMQTAVIWCEALVQIRWVTMPTAKWWDASWRHWEESRQWHRLGQEGWTPSQCCLNEMESLHHLMCRHVAIEMDTWFLVGIPRGWTLDEDSQWS